VSLEQTELDFTLDPKTSDLTDFVGAIVTPLDMMVLQARVNAKGWSIHTLPSGDDWYVTGLSARHDTGKILVGGAEGEGNCFYAIKPGSVLYKRFATAGEYKQWLWQGMQDDVDVIVEMFNIINAPWVGADIYIDGPYAEVVVAAAGYMLSQYSSDGLPIFTKGGKL
jgi:hypothetical protein